MTRVRELQTTYRVRTVDTDPLPRYPLNSPAAIAAMLAKLPMVSTGGTLADAPVEHFGVLCLNTKHRAVAFKIICIGTLDASLCHPREVFAAAIEAHAAAIVVFHNHPSGHPDPSCDDARLTERLTAAGVLMGIDVLDHIIIGHDGAYCSFRERGQL